MPRLESAQISAILRELAQRMELQGDNPYRARAYKRAAENLALTPIPVGQLIAQARLRELPGIGEALAALITELHHTGRHPKLDAMRQEFPSEVLELLRIPGLRAERVRRLHHELGIQSLAQLEEAARSGRLKSLKGYGTAFQAKVLQGLELLRAPEARHLHRAAMAAHYAREQLARAHPDWSRLTAAGELRRGCELVHALSLVADDPAHTGPARVLSIADQVTVHLSSPARYGITLLLATGSERHIAALSALAAKQQRTLTAAGLLEGQRTIAAESEQQLYAALGLPFIAPELRESGAEVERALQGRLPELVVQTDLRGVLHAHTDQSDGADTLEDMAEAARQRGYGYLGLTDHSQTAHYAGGLKVPEVLAQQRAVDHLNERYGSSFHVFKGIESDILADGSLDYSEEILRSFDLIIASVHSRFRMNREQQTERILKAVANPHTVILGHLTGRQLLRRPGYELDLECVLAACAEHEVAVEINANPWRLDMDWRWCTRALELGCMLSINPDAHATNEIDNMQWGVLMARKGAVPKDRVLNALSARDFHTYLQQRKRRLGALA